MWRRMEGIVEGGTGSPISEEVLDRVNAHKSMIKQYGDGRQGGFVGHFLQGSTC